ncbi:MAG TPA: recombination regulator RecX [Burkholderiaceae bacterium]|nr:recombination regulator RecX [Burkholderiaceae bacterium]
MAARGRRQPQSLRARAIALLARREHSRAELGIKLRRSLTDADDPAEVEQVLDDLERGKLLSDERYAGALTRTRSTRFGDARVRFDLKSAGVAAETVDRAVASLAGTEFERARVIWLRRFGEPPRTPQERGRQARFLQARGFSTETIRRLLRGLPDDD